MELYVKSVGRTSDFCSIVLLYDLSSVCKYGPIIFNWHTHITYIN